MGMLSSMDAGVAGLSSHGKALSSTADNIANVSTMGFKATRVNFGDMMVHSLTVGGSVVDQVGVGSRILNVQQMLLQGSFETTEIPTDLAINGNGFFKVRNPLVIDTWGSAKYDADGKPLNMNTGPSFYTRAGQFIIDKEGYMTNPMGLRLQGYNVDKNGTLTQIPEDIRLLLQQVDAIPTSEVDLTLNLNAEDLRYHSPSQPIDPADSSTYNHIVPVRTYDALGVAHDIVMFYQRLEPDSYTGPQIAGTVRSWKVTVMEKVGDTYTQQNLSDGFSGTFYLHFDDVGHLVGNTTGLPAFGDSWSSINSLGTGNSEISNRAGETFSYNTDPNNLSAANETFRTRLLIEGMAHWDSGDEIRINGITYNFDNLTTTYGAGNELNGLISEINRTAGSNGVYCNYNAVLDAIELYTSGNTTAGVTVTNAGANNITVKGLTADEFTNAINNGGASATVADLSKARGMICVPTVPTAAGATITIDGVPLPVGGLADEAALAAALQGAFPDYTFTGTAGSGFVYVEAVAAGSDYNVTLETSSDFTATPNLSGGYTPLPNVHIQQDSVTGLFQFSRTDQGVNAILNVAGNNTMSNGAFNMKQTAFAMDQEEPFSTNSDEVGRYRKGVREISFSWLDATGAHQTQEILLDFIPNITSPTTQSAGSSETFYLNQDGSPRGSLESIDIGRDGLITGNFSNGTVKLMGSVILYNFECPEELKREGENLWSSTMAAGAEIFGRPGQGRMGSVQSGALEKSNVDLAEEMVNMINFQRAFQANSKTIQTTDQLLQELINLKR